MKRIVASVGLVALGASTISALHAQDVSSAPSKSWNVFATLRGFYDDNIDGVENNATESFGYEIMPGASLNWGNNQTTVKAGYTYSFRDYDKNRVYEDKSYDQTHAFDALINHYFTERHQVTVADTFALGQEPDTQRTVGGAYTQLVPVSGDNMRNYGSIYFKSELTPVLSAQLGYANEWVNYEDDGAVVPPFPTPFQPSRSGLLDRVGQTFSLDGQWLLAPETTGLLGYKYSIEDYTGDEVIGVDPLNNPVAYSDARNANSHYIFVGLEHVFRPDLSGGLRGGLRYTSYPDDPVDGGGQASPYVNASLRYSYTVESFGEIGVNYDRSPTDVVSVDANDSVTRDSDSFVIFGSLSHKFTPRLRGSLVANFQNSALNGGLYDSETQLYYNLGLNLKYSFNAHFSAEIGYNYDSLDSDVPGYNYDRNRAYVGVTATY